SAAMPETYRLRALPPRAASPGVDEVQPDGLARDWPGLSAGAGQGLVADGGPDTEPGLVQPALEGGLADPGDLRGLLRGHALDVTQDERGPQRRRQAGQRTAQGPAQFAVLGLPGRVQRGGRGQLEFVGSDGDPRRAARPLLQGPVGLVDRDPVQP